ncbi:hypothetical protein ABIB40_004190 [Pedobacter sp. UYP30]|uniref:hypothetical protein n=1 Tax=Pedobacter sp. UYP30 TaxID=1756400 RepID=UPI0033952876
MGTDRKLLFSKSTNNIKVQNYSKDKWNSSIDFELLDATELKNHIIKFVEKIKSIVEIACPRVNDIKLLKDWYKKFLQTPNIANIDNEI